MAKSDDDEQTTIHIQSHNQQGGITAHTVNVYGSIPARATYQETEREDVAEGHVTRGLLTLDGQFVLPVLVIIARGQGVKSVSARQAGMVSSQTNVLQGSFNDGSGAFYQTGNASGEYVVEIVSERQVPIELSVSQERLM